MSVPSKIGHVCEQCKSFCSEEVYKDEHEFVKGDPHHSSICFCSMECKDEYYWDERIRDMVDDMIEKERSRIDQQLDAAHRKVKESKALYKEKLRKELSLLHQAVCSGCANRFPQVLARIRKGK